MKQFRKRTLALILASTISVVGAFGSEYYKNSLMSLEFSTVQDGAVAVSLFTKTQYEREITPSKKDANTYVIMLPDVNSEVNSSVRLGAGIAGVDIKTMPYTTQSNGYTKITIKTIDNIPLEVNSALYIPKKETPSPALIQTAQQNEPIYQQNEPQPVQQPVQQLYNEPPQINIQKNTIHSNTGVSQTTPVDIKDSVKQFQPSKNQNTTPHKIETVQPIETQTNVNTESENNSDWISWFLGTALVLMLILFFFFKAKGKMNEILGEQFSINLNEPSEKEISKKKKQKSVKATIKELDKQYSSSSSYSMMNTINTAPEYNATPEEFEQEKNIEPDIIVDLDELLQKTIETSNINEENEPNEEEEAENFELESFLQAFNTPIEEEIPEEHHDEIVLEEELYEKYINNDSIRFSKDDIEKISTLIQMEVSDDTLKYARNTLKSKAIVTKPSQQKLLEDIITTYSIKQDITFSRNDIETINQLLNVEVDPDFITNLHTNPIRTAEMHNEILASRQKTRKIEEPLILNVKDMLPDLSAALKELGGRKVQSNFKPQMEYYGENYEAKVLELDTEMPDLSIEINNKEAYKPRPSDVIAYVDNSYEVSRLSINDDLPDLKDVMEHPEKYESKPPQPVEVDEDALLRNITNVMFKPFSDGRDDFEIINTFIDLDKNNSEESSVNSIDSVFNDFDAFVDTNTEQPKSDTITEEIQNLELIQNDENISYYENNNESIDIPVESSKTDSDKIEKEEVVNDTNMEVLIENNDTTELPNNNETEPVVENEETDIEPTKEIELPLIAKRKSLITKKDRSNSQTNELLERIKNFKLRENKNIQKTKTNEESDKQIKDKSTDIPEFFILDGEKYSVLKDIKISDEIGCYLAKNRNYYKVVGYLGSKIIDLKSYSSLKKETIQIRKSDSFEDGYTRYIVKVGTNKFLIDINENNMEFVMDLC